jgi:Phosphotransferase enzyme family
MAPFVNAMNPLAAITIRGWEVFGETVPAEVADPVFALLADPQTLADALQSRPTTLIHGDLATVNMAFSDGELTLLDWAMPAAAPGAVDIARFVAGCASVVDMSREDSRPPICRSALVPERRYAWPRTRRLHAGPAALSRCPHTASKPACGGTCERIVGVRLPDSPTTTGWLVWCVRLAGRGGGR